MIVFRRVYIIFLFWILIWPADAVGQEKATKYWIFLTDKAGTAGKIAHVEPDYLTDRALDRRQLRGQRRVDFLDAPLSIDYLQALGEMDIEPLVKSRWLNAVSAWLTPNQVKDLGKVTFVKNVRPVGRTRSVPDPDDVQIKETVPYVRKHLLDTLDYGGSEQQLAVINALGPLERGLNGTGVRLGFLDTEFGDFQHPVFQRMVAEGRLIAHKSFTDTTQTNRHGLSVASVAAGYAEGFLIGPAYGTEVLAATTEYAPTETNQEEDNWVAGIEWLESQGADVVNSSLGYSDFDVGEQSYSRDDLDGDTGMTTIAADIAASLGVVVVNSAGNEGVCFSPSLCWYYIIMPADGHSVIAVGAVNPDSSRSSFSSYGPTADGRTKPDVSAPGSRVRIATTTGYSSFGSGTSFASPLVAGVACQILQVNPYLTPIEVRDLLRESASQAQQPDNVLGWGVINADAAIQRARQLTHVDEFPEKTLIKSVYPNPFSDRTTFVFQSPSYLAHASLSIYDILGRKVALPHDGALSAGYHRFDFDGALLPPGIYLYVFESEQIRESGKIVLAR